jgi:Tol biopolymer transport system component
MEDAPEERPAVHLEVELPEGSSIEGFPIPSPDGREIAFVAHQVGSSRPGRVRALWARALDSLTPRLLAEGAPPGGVQGHPFWSPDSQFIAYGEGGELKKVGLSDGTVQVLCALPQTPLFEGAWNGEGRILFSSGGRRGGIYSIAATGGEAKPVTRVDEPRGETGHYAPQFAPDGRHFFIEVEGPADVAGLYVASLENPEERRRIAPGEGYRQLVAGRWLFVRDATLLTQRFDPEGLGLAGEPVTVVSPVAVLASTPGVGFFSATPSGALAWVEGQDDSGVELVWCNREGKRLESVGKPGRYGQLALSPDERNLAVELKAQGQGFPDIWTIDLARGVATRTTFDPGIDVDPVWSPDGRALVYSSYRDDVFRIYRKALEGNEPESLLREDVENALPESWTPESGGIVYGTEGGTDEVFGLLAPEGDKEPETIPAKDFDLDEPQVSPDGRWLAYLSHESGEWEVYVEPYRRVGPRVRVSPGGGGQPKWRGDGKELFYAAPDGRLMAVEMQAGERGLEVGLPTPLFDARATDPIRDEYAVTADGQRFLVKVPVENQSSRRLHVIVNWTSLLE